MTASNAAQGAQGRGLAMEATLAMFDLSGRNTRHLLPSRPALRKRRAADKDLAAIGSDFRKAMAKTDQKIVSRG